MIRALRAADTIEAQALLRERPLRNVFLDHVVSAGVLGRAPGFYGWESDGRLRAVLMIGPLGGTTLEVLDDDAFPSLADAAARAPIRPRHIVGDEAVTAPFWCAYQSHAAPVRWTRREPFYVLEAAGFRPMPGRVCVEPAREHDLEEIVENSALQHAEDLADDRRALDPEGFRDRHAKDVRDHRWWVLREHGRIVFQAHVGAENGAAIQLGGVMTPPDERGRGHAKRGVAAICAALLERRPAVSLFCAEDNQPARHVYEHVGFRQRFHYRSWLLDEPLTSASEDAAYL